LVLISAPLLLCSYSIFLNKNVVLSGLFFWGHYNFVKAYRYLNEYNQVVEYSSDDGEPSGTSGKPSLMVLQGHELINVAVIIVRYFGGTKLGTGGLVRAYSDAVNLVVENAELFAYTKEIECSVAFRYADVRLVEYACEKYNIAVKEKSFDIDVVYKLEASQENMRNFLSSLNRVVEQRQ
jgi:uncharacterized YigZ family protein